MPIRFAQTMQRVHMLTFMRALLLFGLPWLLMYALQFAMQPHLMNYLIGPAIACNIIVVWVGTIYRGKLRDRYQIPGSGCEDCLMHTFCRCCAIAQEARHVDRDFAIPI